MEELIYNKLENRLGEMKTLSPEETAEKISPQAKKYLDGFGERIFDVKKMAEGMDSTVFLAKLRGFENRTQLIKVYDGLSRSLRHRKHDLAPILKKYFEICQDVRDYLKKEDNPLKKKISISNKHYSPQFSVAPMGILVEMNGEVGSWVREWIPGKNFDYSQSESSEGRVEISTYVKEVCNLLSNKFDHRMMPSSVNYKVTINDENKTIQIIFTDITDFIPRMIKENDISND